MTVELALIVSIVSVAFSIFFGLKNNKRTDTKDIEERVKENTRINLKLDDIASTIREVKTEIASLKDEMQNHNDRIIKVEESAKQGHKRLDAFENRLVMLEKSIGGGK